MRNLIYISLALALSVNAIAKPLYKDVLVGTTKISDLVETFEKKINVFGIKKRIKIID